MSVPRLDLAPKLRHPLRLWNPFDYIRLIYWVFFFPQAIRWYVETFAGGEPSAAEGLERPLTALLSHPIRLRLLIQAVTIVITIPVLIAGLLEWIGASVGWFGVMFGTVFSVGFGVASGVAFSTVVGIAVGVIVGVAVGAVTGLTISITFAMPVGAAGGVIIGVWFGVVFSLTVISAFGVTPGIAVVVGIGVLFGVVLGKAFDIVAGAVAGLAVCLSLLRPAAWLAGLPYALWLARADTTYHNATALLSHVTPIPLPGLRKRLQAWLLTDWSAGLHNVSQFLLYSLHFLPAVGAVNEALAVLPSERLLPAIAQLAEVPYGWDLMRLDSTSVGQAMKAEVLEGFFFVPRPWRQRVQAFEKTATPPDSPARAGAAGFRYLYEMKPQKAAMAFATIRSLPHGVEMHRLAHALAMAQTPEDLPTLASLASKQDFVSAVAGTQSDAPLPDRNSPVWTHSGPLHPTAWEGLAHLQRAAMNAWTIQVGASRAARSQALHNALRELATLLESADTVPETERDLMCEIAVRWREAILTASEMSIQANEPEPVTNPYVAGDPVLGSGFIGREEILRRLEALWLGSQVPPSVVLFGHRRMGKTSILRNLAGHLGASVHLAYVDLHLLGEAPGGVGDVLLALADSVAQTLRAAGLPIPAIDTEELTTRPYRAFKQFLQTVRGILGEDRLILAMDEFEQLENWMKAGQLPRGFLKVLRGYIHMDPHIAFAFAGLHTLREMTSDYFAPFFGSVTAVKTPFLSRTAVFKLLANPAEDFPLEYSPEAQQRVWQLTKGQPYLVQLVGHRLVSRYNDQVLEEGWQPESRFTAADVEAVVNDPEFYSTGFYYFTGIWGQAGQDPPGQQDLLRTLAPHQEGLDLQELAPNTEMDEEILSAALSALKRHGVVVEETQRWQYKVELMRQWVLQEQVDQEKARRMAALEEARALGERIRAGRPAHDVDSTELLRELREARADSTD
jgi:hypothetical protein